MEIALHAVLKVLPDRLGLLAGFLDDATFAMMALMFAGQGRVELVGVDVDLARAVEAAAGGDPPAVGAHGHAVDRPFMGSNSRIRFESSPITRTVWRKTR